jgi:hypothetical protein
VTKNAIGSVASLLSSGIGVGRPERTERSKRAHGKV